MFPFRKTQPHAAAYNQFWYDSLIKPYLYTATKYYDHLDDFCTDVYNTTVGYGQRADDFKLDGLKDKEKIFQNDSCAVILKASEGKDGKTLLKVELVIKKSQPKTLYTERDAWDDWNYSDTAGADCTIVTMEATRRSVERSDLTDDIEKCIEGYLKCLILNIRGLEGDDKILLQAHQCGREKYAGNLIKKYSRIGFFPLYKSRQLKGLEAKFAPPGLDHSEVKGLLRQPPS